MNSLISTKKASHKHQSSTLSLAVSLFSGTLLAGTLASADPAANPFSAVDLGGGYQVAATHSKQSEGKCGEAKCGADMAADKMAEGKCGEAKCGADMAKDKTSEAKCGEGKCGNR